MGWFLRKAFSFGPVRLNLSKSGLGISVGVKGLRIGAGPRGPYVAGGRHGLYFRNYVRTTGGELGPSTQPLSAPNFWFVGLILSLVLTAVGIFSSLNWLAFAGVCGAAIFSGFALYTRARSKVAFRYLSLLHRLSPSEDEGLLRDLLVAQQQGGLTDADLFQTHERTYQWLVLLCLRKSPDDVAALKWVRRVGSFLHLSGQQQKVLELKAWEVWVTEARAESGHEPDIERRISSVRQALGISAK